MRSWNWKKLVLIGWVLLGIASSFPLTSMDVQAQDEQVEQAHGDEAAPAKGGVRPDLNSKVKMWLAIAAGFGIAIASFGGAISQARAISAAVDGIARNPGAAGKIFAPTLIVGLALIESLVLYAWIVALQLAGKI